MLELGASLSSRHSSAHVPSTKPGARNAAIGGRFSFAPYSTSAHVLARVQQLHRPRGRRQPAAPAERAEVLAAERGQRAVRARARGDALDRRVAVAGDHVLLAARHRAANRPAGAARQLGGDARVVAGAVLRAEAAAHVLADDAHLVRREAERARRPRRGRPRCTASRRRRRARRRATRTRHWCVSSELWFSVCVRYSASTTTSASASPRSKSPRS